MQGIYFLEFQKNLVGQRDYGKENNLCSNNYLNLFNRF